MGNANIPEKAPFVVDEARWEHDRVTNENAKQFPTFDSVVEGFEAIGKPEAAVREVKFPRGGKVYEGPFAELTAQYCPIKHLADGWPTVFQQYVAMVEHFQPPPGPASGKA
jgi:hypothetical protein